MPAPGLSRRPLPWVPLLVVCAGTAAPAALLPAPPAPRAVAQGGLAEWPNLSATAFQTVDRLTVVVFVPPGDPKDRSALRVELVGPRDRVLAGAERKVGPKASGQRFTFRPPGLPPEDVRLRCRLGRSRFQAGLDEVLVGKAHETVLSAGRDLFAGSEGALCCEVRGAKSGTDSVPVAGAAVTVRLLDKGGKVFPLYQGKTGPDGRAAVRFRVPAVPAGVYRMEVCTRSEFGSERLVNDVTVLSGEKVHLITDKPLYQPGQVMHLRALALHPFDLTPVAGAGLTFEVEDARGNKVFARTLQTSDYGIAAADFQLADEVNQGDYRVRAVLGSTQALRTVAVRRYVLPKFKIEMTADKRYYLVRQTLHADLQADYFFGKPVAGAGVKVTAGVGGEPGAFQTWEGKTDERGHARFEVKLPAWLAGERLRKSGGRVRLEASVTDTAGHTQTAGRDCPVSDEAIAVSLIPEGAHLVPGMENRVLVATLYPDGSPARCTVQVSQGFPGRGKPVATVRTGPAGLGEFRITPGPGLQGQGPFGRFAAPLLPDLVLTAHARDARGNRGTGGAWPPLAPAGANVLLRLDKAIYKRGEVPRAEVCSSAGLPSVGVEVVRGGQVVWTQTLAVKDGKAAGELKLPADLFGTLEVHAYQTLETGEVIHDARVVYVKPAADLKVRVKADRPVYRPGAEGKIRFEVTDRGGKPAAAALGVLVVDEAVYALRDVRPGLEKVYFTLQQELARPPEGASYRPAESLAELARGEGLTEQRQQVARALLAAVVPKEGARWRVDPEARRRSLLDVQLQVIGLALFEYARTHGPEKVLGPKGFRAGVLAELAREKRLPAWVLSDGTTGEPLDLNAIARVAGNFTPGRLGAALTRWRMGQLVKPLVGYAAVHAEVCYKGGRWTLPEGALAGAVKLAGLKESALKDAWGRPVRLVRLEKPRPRPGGKGPLNDYDLASAGPDGTFGTADDIKVFAADSEWDLCWWWALDGFMRTPEGLTVWTNYQPARLPGLTPGLGMMGRGMVNLGAGGIGMGMMGMAGMGGMGVAGGGFGLGLGVGGAVGGMPPVLPRKLPEPRPAPGRPADGGGPAPAARLREYFPETLLWRPALITDDRGVAVMSVPFADSVTTWRLTASASSRAGALGGASAPLRVFQDFFIDPDLPLNLTQNDEVAFPVAVHNYLKTPQTVRLDLQAEPWFELADGGGLSRSVDLGAGEVRAVRFRVRARRPGHFALTVKAHGGKVADAVRRPVEVVPDGRRVERVVTDRLRGTVTQTITVPGNAIDGASKLLVKVYPGVISQVLEGTEGMLSMPHGCMEQTSSSAYPNLLVVDYLKKARRASPEVLARAERLLGVGYQRLLTFERPGGGFDWWGTGEPLVGLSALALHEFNDMAKVYPVDRAVILRTRAFLLKQQAKDGTWSKAGFAHDVTPREMGDPKLLLTSYVAWSLLDSGLRVPELKKSVAYIRAHVGRAENPYALALAANALAAWDAKDDSTYEVLRRLNALRKDRPGWDASYFPAEGESLVYARGESLTVETTALAVLAMLRNGQFAGTVNRGLTYLVRSKDPGGTWGSTSATVLALKALVAAAGPAGPARPAAFTVLVNGREAAKGKVTRDNADVVQLFDLPGLRRGRNEVTLRVEGDPGLLYQVVGRYFVPWKKDAPAKPVLELTVDPDRTRLATRDAVKVRATLKYNGTAPRRMVMVELGVPPGFTVDEDGLARLVRAGRVEKFAVAPDRVTLYLGTVKPGAQGFEYGIRPKYPGRVKTPPSAAYEYYTPSIRAAAPPVELVVEDKR